MAASARTSGTSAPFASSLNRGSFASRSAAACAVARDRATLVRRACAFAAEYVDFLACVVCASVSFLPVGRRVVVVWAARVSADRPTHITAARIPNRQTVVESRNRVTGEAFGRQLVTRSIGILANIHQFARPLIRRTTNARTTRHPFQERCHVAWD